MGRKSTNKSRMTNSAKREEWIRSLYPFFRIRGLMGFSMEEVAGFLDVSKATIYNYFTSKEEIIDHYVASKLNDFNQFNLIFGNKRLSLIERYEKSLYHLLQEMCDLSPEVRNDLKYIFPELWTRLAEALDGYLSSIKSLYETGFADGSFNPINPSLLIMCDRNMLFFMSDPTQLKQSGLTLEKAFSEYMYMRQNGLIRSSD